MYTTRKLWSRWRKNKRGSQTGDSGLAFSMNLSWFRLIICSVRLKCGRAMTSQRRRTSPCLSWKRRPASIPLERRMSQMRDQFCTGTFSCSFWNKGRGQSHLSFRFRSLPGAQDCWPDTSPGKPWVTCRTWWWWRGAVGWCPWCGEAAAWSPGDTSEEAEQ